MDAPWFGFVIGVLATWRVAHLLAHEDGPWDAVLRLRGALGNGLWGRLLDCFACVSLWVAAPIALAVARTPVEGVMAWLALSGAACLLERVAGTQPAIIQPLDLTGDDDGLLRTETGSPERGRADDDRHDNAAQAAGQIGGPLHIVR